MLFIQVNLQTCIYSDDHTQVLKVDIAARFVPSEYMFSGIIVLNKNAQREFRHANMSS